ncbi:MAG TPA: hypothetical protein DDZ51_20720 [Planctomycetaceae bacterium]|nr:hypothetical protein [Planctomycetaceae bacterium]
MIQRVTVVLVRARLYTRSHVRVLSEDKDANQDLPRDTNRTLSALSIRRQFNTFSDRLGE